MPSKLKAHLFITGVGHKVRNGYEIHWSWVAYRGEKLIDKGVMTGGDLVEGVDTWPDKKGMAEIVKEQKRLIAKYWMNEFFVDNVDPDVNVTLRKSSDETLIRGYGSRR